MFEWDEIYYKKIVIYQYKDTDHIIHKNRNVNEGQWKYHYKGLIFADLELSKRHASRIIIREELE